jgi:hypothetical protein
LARSLDAWRVHCKRMGEIWINKLEWLRQNTEHLAYGEGVLTQMEGHRARDRQRSGAGLQEGAREVIGDEGIDGTRRCKGVTGAGCMGSRGGKDMSAVAQWCTGAEVHRLEEKVVA